MTSAKTIENSLESMIEHSAQRIACGDGNYHSSSMRSEMANLTAIVRSMLVVAVNRIREND